MKRKYLQRAIALGLASAMVLGTVGCGGNKKDEKKAEVKIETEASDGYKAGDTFKASEPAKFSLMYSDHENYPQQDDWLLWKAIEEKTNVTFDLTVVARTDYEQKRSLLISSGDAPLIIPKMYPGSEKQFVASGALLPISDYVNENYMPNYCEKIKEWDMESDLNQIRQDNGKYYLLPGLHETAFTDYTYLVRKDVFDKLGITVDDASYTYDQFYNDLKKVKGAYPDNYVISDRFKGEALLDMVSAAYGARAGWSKETGTKFDWDKEEFYFSPVSDGYKDFVTYLSKLSEDGILNPESLTQDDDSAIADFTTGKSFVISTNTQMSQDIQKKMTESLGEGNFELMQILPPQGTMGAVLNAASRLENGVAISSKALELGQDGLRDLLRFVDWLWYSDEGQMLTKWGVEGETYDMVDGKPVLKSDIYYNGVNPDAKKQLNVDYGFSNGVFSYGGSDELFTSMYSDFALDYFNRATTLREAAKLDPPIMFDADTAESMGLISTPLMDYATQMTSKFILDQEDIDKKWDEYVSTCEGMSMQQFIDQCNTTYKETKDLLK